jgi:hypothetical protein
MCRFRRLGTQLHPVCSLVQLSNYLGMGIQAGRLIRGQFDPEQTWGIATMCLGELSSMKK